MVVVVKCDGGGCWPAGVCVCVEGRVELSRERRGLCGCGGGSEMRWWWLPTVVCLCAGTCGVQQGKKGVCVCVWS